MSNIHSLSLFVLFFLLSDALGAVIQPRLYDHSFNHRRSMLEARNHINIEARSEVERQESTLFRLLINGQSGEQEPPQIEIERSVFYVDLNSWAPDEFGPGPFLLVVLNSPKDGAAAQVLIRVQESRNDIAHHISRTVFDCVPGVSFEEQTGFFVLRYVPWSLFQNQVARGKIDRAQMNRLRPMPFTECEPGDIVQILANKIDGDNADGQIRTALCVSRVQKAPKTAYFAVLYSDPGDKPFHSAIEYTLPTKLKNQVLVVVKARKQQIIQIGKLSEQEKGKLIDNEVKTASATSIKPKRFVTFPFQSLLRPEGDPRDVNFNGKKPFGVVLGLPHRIDGITLTLPVGVFLFDPHDDWPGGISSKKPFKFDQERLSAPWKMVPGEVELIGVTAIEGHENRGGSTIDNFAKALPSYTGPHISRPRSITD